MKKIALLTLSFLLSSSCIYADGKVVATYDNQKVTEEEVSKTYLDAFKGQPNFDNKPFKDLDSKVKEALIKSHVLTKLLQNEGKKQNIEASKSFQDKLTNIKTQLVQQELFENYIKQNVKDTDITEEYNKLVASLKGQDEIKIAHILVDTEDKAKSLRARITKGANFNELAKTNSKDEASKANGGTLGYFVKGSVLPNIESTVFAMTKGEVSNPVKTDAGWHIFKIEDKRKAKIPTKEEATVKIQNAKKQEAIMKYIQELNDKAGTKITLD